MASPASFGKHPIHPMLVVFPIGLWVFSFILDIFYIAGWGGALWRDVSFFAIAGGIIGGVIAAIPGLIDYTTLTGRTKTIASWHLSLNLILVLLFAVNFYVRSKGGPILGAPFILSVIGVILLSVSGWLGGELVYVHGVAVEPRAQRLAP